MKQKGARKNTVKVAKLSLQRNAYSLYSETVVLNDVPTFAQL